MTPLQTSVCARPRTSSSEASVMRYAPPSSKHVSPYSAPPEANAAAASGPNGRPQNRSCSLSSLQDLRSMLSADQL